MRMFYGNNQVRSLDECIVYVTIDPGGGCAPAQATARTDKWGWAVVAVDQQNQWFLLELWEEHLSDDMFIDRLWSVYEKWRPYLIGVEKMPHLDTVIRQSMLNRNRTLPLVELKPGGRAKELRIRGLHPLLENIHVSDRIASAVQHKMQTWYTEMEHGDDALDAFAYVIDIARPPTSQQLIAYRRSMEEHETQLRLQSLPETDRKEWEYWEKRKHRQEASVTEMWEDMYGDVQDESFIDQY